jgi:hypothetical protein
MLSCPSERPLNDARPAGPVRAYSRRRTWRGKASAHLQTIHLQAEGHSALFLDVRFLGYLDRVERPTALT